MEKKETFFELRFAHQKQTTELLDDSNSVQTSLVSRRARLGEGGSGSGWLFL